MAEIDLPELLVPRETAKVRRTTIGHLANERSRGLGPPFVKLGGRIFYPKNSLAKYISERIVDPTRRAG
jgi:hypothetical protein